MSTIKKALFDINVCIRLFLMNDNSQVLSKYWKLQQNVLRNPDSKRMAIFSHHRWC